MHPSRPPALNISVKFKNWFYEVISQAFTTCWDKSNFFYFEKGGIPAKKWPVAILWDNNCLLWHQTCFTKYKNFFTQVLWANNGLLWQVKCFITQETAEKAYLGQSEAQAVFTFNLKGHNKKTKAGESYKSNTYIYLKYFWILTGKNIVYAANWKEVCILYCITWSKFSLFRFVTSKDGPKTTYNC